MVTLADVARRANVSKMTVSRVINHPEQVTDELKNWFLPQCMSWIIAQTLLQRLLPKTERRLSNFSFWKKFQLSNHTTQIFCLAFRLRSAAISIHCSLSQITTLILAYATDTLLRECEAATMSGFLESKNQ